MTAAVARGRAAFRAWNTAFDQWVLSLPLVAARARWRIVHWDGGAIIDAAPLDRGDRIAVRMAARYGASIALSLPGAARRDLDAAIELALPEAAPAPMDMLCAAWSSDEIRERMGRLELPVLLAARDVVSAAAAAGEQAFGRVDCVDVEDPEHPDAPPRLNLRAGMGTRTRASSPGRALAFACCVLLLVGGISLLAARLAPLGGRTQAALAQADVQAGIALAGERAARPPAIPLIAALTDALPDSAYLERLEIDGAQVRMEGRAKRGAMVLPALQARHAFVGAAFAGPLRAAPDGRQRFEITASAAPGRSTR